MPSPFANFPAVYINASPRRSRPDLFSVSRWGGSEINSLPACCALQQPKALLSEFVAVSYMHRVMHGSVERDQIPFAPLILWVFRHRKDVMHCIRFDVPSVSQRHLTHVAVTPQDFSSEPQPASAFIIHNFATQKTEGMISVFREPYSIKFL